jgi:hypothetical protein
MVESLSESLKLAIEHYSGTVNQVLTLSTALVGLGGAVLLGMKDLTNLTKASRILILASTTSFAFSAYFALVWQSWLGWFLFNDCPTSISQPVMKVPFLADTYFFVIGLVLMAGVVLTAVFARPSQGNSNEDTKGT